jgi:hypothetical protein
MNEAKRPEQQSAETRAMTVRLPADQSEELEKIAQIEGVSIAEAVREAVARHIAERRDDPAFRRRVRDIIEHDRAILERLAD